MISNIVKPFAFFLCLVASLALSPRFAHAEDTFDDKDTISTVAVSTSSDNLYFWMTSTTHDCGADPSTKWTLPLDGSQAVEATVKVVYAAFLAGKRVAMSYSCSNGAAIVAYVKVYN